MMVSCRRRRESSQELVAVARSCRAIQAVAVVVLALCLPVQCGAARSPLPHIFLLYVDDWCAHLTISQFAR